MQKYYNQFNVMTRFRLLIRREILFKLYKAYILPQSSVWHFWGARDAEKLEALNKRMLRIIIGDYSSPYTNLVSKVKSTSLCNKRVQNFFICHITVCVSLIFLLIWRICFHSDPLPMIFVATTFFHLVNLKELPTILNVFLTFQLDSGMHCRTFFVLGFFFQT